MNYIVFLNLSFNVFWQYDVYSMSNKLRQVKWLNKMIKEMMFFVKYMNITLAKINILIA